MSNLVPVIFLGLGAILVMISLGGLWSIRRRTNEPEEALFHRLLVLYLLFGFFLLFIPCLLFLFQYFFFWKNVFLFPIYLNVASVLGVICSVWSAHAIIRALPGRARDIYPRLLYANIQLIISSGLGLFLDYNIQMLLSVTLPTVDVRQAGIIGISVEAIVMLGSSVLYILFLVRYRADKTSKDATLW